MTQRFGDLSKTLVVIEQQIMALEQQNDPQYADALASLRAKQQELVRRLSNSGVASKESSAIGSQSVYVGRNMDHSTITQGTGNTVQTTTFDQRGQKVHSQTNIAGDAKGPILSGTFHGPVSTGHNMQTGGIPVGKINAQDVTVGANLSGTVNDSAVKLAQALMNGDISVEDIEGKDVTVGLRVVSNLAQATTQIKEAVNVLQKQLQAAILLGEIEDEDDQEEVKSALTRAKKELSKTQPKPKRIISNLERVAEIIIEASQQAEAAGRMTSPVIYLAPQAAILVQLARQEYGQ